MAYRLDLTLTPLPNNDDTFLRLCDDITETSILIAVVTFTTGLSGDENTIDVFLQVEESIYYETSPTSLRNPLCVYHNKPYYERADACVVVVMLLHVKRIVKRISWHGLLLIRQIKLFASCGNDYTC
jgi:hypothetical protein